jgi:hypothetical protein
MFIPPIVARQRVGKHIPAATNSHATIEKLLDASFSVLSVLYEGKVGKYFFPELLVYFMMLSVATVHSLPSFGNNK